MNLLPKDLNLDPHPLYPTSTCTCEVTIVPMVCDDDRN